MEAEITTEETDEKFRKIVFRDAGEMFIMNFNNQLEAVGAMDVWTGANRIKDLINAQKKALSNFAPIPGEVVAYEGGEFLLKAFRNPYEAIGFIVVRMSPENIQNIINQMCALSPEKFHEVQEAGKVRHKQRLEHIQQLWERDARVRELVEKEKQGVK